MSAIGGKADIPATEDQCIELVPEYPRSGTLTFSDAASTGIRVARVVEAVGESQRPDGLEKAMADSQKAAQELCRPEWHL
jgi:hypothetical protein